MGKKPQKRQEKSPASNNVADDTENGEKSQLIWGKIREILDKNTELVRGKCGLQIWIILAR